MKLLYCQDCGDIFNLTKKLKFCSCGATGGKYLNNTNAEYYGSGIPLGFDNFSLIAAIENRPDHGKGKVFEAFVIPVECGTMKKPKQE